MFISRISVNQLLKTFSSRVCCQGIKPLIEVPIRRKNNVAAPHLISPLKSELPHFIGGYII